MSKNRTEKGNFHGGGLWSGGKSKENDRSFFGFGKREADAIDTENSGGIFGRGAVRSRAQKADKSGKSGKGGKSWFS